MSVAASPTATWGTAVTSTTIWSMDTRAHRAAPSRISIGLVGEAVAVAVRVAHGQDGSTRRAVGGVGPPVADVGMRLELSYLHHGGFPAQYAPQRVYRGGSLAGPDPVADETGPHRVEQAVPVIDDGRAVRRVRHFVGNARLFDLPDQLPESLDLGLGKAVVHHIRRGEMG